MAYCGFSLEECTELIRACREDGGLIFRQDGRRRESALCLRKVRSEKTEIFGPEACKCQIYEFSDILKGKDFNRGTDLKGENGLGGQT